MEPEASSTRTEQDPVPPVASGDSSLGAPPVVSPQAAAPMAPCQPEESYRIRDLRVTKTKAELERDIAIFNFEKMKVEHGVNDIYLGNIFYGCIAVLAVSFTAYLSSKCIGSLKN